MNIYDTINQRITCAQVSLLCSMSQDGFPKTRAMLAPCAIENPLTLIYHTNTSSQKVSEYSLHSEAGVYFFNAGTFQGLFLKGHMQILHTQEYKNHYWQDPYQLYYPLGATDPDYCILKFTPLSAEFYENFRVEQFQLS